MPHAIITLLTVGDGLVTQVPALIVSTAAGLLVTRTATSAELGDEVKTQVLFSAEASLLRQPYCCLFLR